MASSADAIGVPMIHWEEGVVAGGQSRRQPGGRSVACCASCRPARRHVIRIRGSSEVRLVAAVAVERHGEVVALVAVLAGAPRVRIGELHGGVRVRATRPGVERGRRGGMARCALLVREVGRVVRRRAGARVVVARRRRGVAGLARLARCPGVVAARRVAVGARAHAGAVLAREREAGACMIERSGRLAFFVAHFARIVRVAGEACFMARDDGRLFLDRLGVVARDAFLIFVAIGALQFEHRDMIVMEESHF